MKKIILVALIGIFTACNSAKPISEKTKVETKKEELDSYKHIVKEVNAKKNEDGYLVGIANKDYFTDDAFKEWFNSRYSEYTTDKEIITKLKEALKGFTIKGFMGTWCGDSRRETPRFFKLLDETGFDQTYFELITVDRTKTTPDNLQEGFNIIRVPTFIFSKNGKEVGRYVEYPRETLEKDILKIVTGQPYKHSYDNSK
jgi:thiol-disulfide isomerase/thioredoxin